MSLLLSVSVKKFIFLPSGKVKGELSDGGWLKYWGQTSEDPQGGVDPCQPPLHQVMWSGETPTANNTLVNCWHDKTSQLWSTGV